MALRKISPYKNKKDQNRFYLMNKYIILLGEFYIFVRN